MDQPSKVGDFDLAMSANKEIFWLDISRNDMLFVTGSNLVSRPSHKCSEPKSSRGSDPSSHVATLVGELVLIEFTTWWW
jgi:hypothetical protein